MAKKKSDVNKSAAIREILGKNPKTSVSEVVATLAGQGIKVSNNLVYLIKSKMGARRRKMKRQKAVAMSNSAGIANPVDLIRGVRVLAEKAGGIRKLKELVEILAE